MTLSQNSLTLPKEAQDAIDILFPNRAPDIVPEENDARLHHAAVAATEHVQQQHGGKIDTNRLRCALELVLANAVTANLDGTATVRSHDRCHGVTGESCTCEDFSHRQATCKHILAVAIYARTAALLNGEGKAPSTAPRSAAWNVNEAPVSCNLKLRVGQIELMYTMRDVDDAALQARLKDVLPCIQAMQDDADTRQVGRCANRAETPAQPEAIAQLVENALQQTLAANGANHKHNATNSDAPTCPEHGPMRPSAKQPGGFYCPKKLQTGKWCPSRYTPRP